MHSFSRKLRLLTPKDFHYVFQQPQRASYPEITILGRRNQLGYPRLGITIAKKSVKLAHERNRIKRLIREYFRLHQYELPLMDFVVLVKNVITDLNNQKITEKLSKLWHRHYLFVRGYS